MEGGDSEFANFKLPTLKAFLEARSQNVSGNKQEFVARVIDCPKIIFPRTHDLLVSKKEDKKRKEKKKKTQRHFFPPSIPFPR